MANMSYCRFQNTLNDLRDCAENWNNELSDDENWAREKMLELCREIVEEYDDALHDGRAGRRLK